MLNRFVLLLIAVAAGVCVSPLRAQFNPDRPDRYDAGMDVDWPLYEDPLLLPPDRVNKFHSRLKELWVAALGRPDAETRRRAAHAIGDAHERGMQGLSETAPLLMKLLEKPGENAIVRFAAARSLIQLDHRPAGALMVKYVAEVDAVAHARELALLVDPALAAWDVDAARAAWRARLKEPGVGHALRMSAIDALRRVKDEASAEVMLALAGDAQEDPSVRLAAARAAGAIRPSGLAGRARELARGSMIERLVAASLLSHHEGDDAVAVLLELARDAQPAVAAIALDRLLAIRPDAVVELAPELLANADAKVRRLAAEAALHERSPRAVARVGPLLADPSTDVRRYVRGRLIELADEAALDQPVREVAMGVLGGGAWRGQIDAAIVLGRLDHEPAAARLVELMQQTPRHDVRLAAIVALRRLAVPDTTAALWTQTDQMTRDWLAIERRRTQEKGYVPSLELIRWYDVQISQLMQALGLLGARSGDAAARELVMTQAVPRMRELVPKGCGFFEQARAGAIWALGLLYEQSPDAALAEAFRQRLADTNPTNPEMVPVRRAGGVAVGRMRFEGGINTLRQFYREEKFSADIGGACAWSIERITGEKLLPLPTIESNQSGWFLQPIGIE